MTGDKLLSRFSIMVGKIQSKSSNKITLLDFKKLVE